MDARTIHVVNPHARIRRPPPALGAESSDNVISVARAPEFWVRRGLYEFWVASLFILGILMCIPSLLSWRHVISTYASVGAFNMALAGIMVGLCMDRHDTTRLHPLTHSRYFLLTRSVPNTIKTSVVIAGLATGYIFSKGVYDMAVVCPIATEDTLAKLIYNDTMGACNSTLVDLNRRLPFFSETLANLLRCLDDLVITSIFLAGMGLLFVLDVAVFVHALMMSGLSHAVSASLANVPSPGLAMPFASNIRARLGEYEAGDDDDDDDELVPRIGDPV